MATINIEPTTASFTATGGQGTITLTDTASASWHDTPQSGDNWAAIREKDGNSWSDWFVFSKNGGGGSGDYLPLTGGDLTGAVRMTVGSNTTYLKSYALGHASGSSYTYDGYLTANSNGAAWLYGRTELNLVSGYSSSSQGKLTITASNVTFNGSSLVSVAQGAITNATNGVSVGTITVTGTPTVLYAPKVTVTQTLSSGVEVGRIKVGSANAVILYAPDGGSGTAGVSSWAGLSGTISLTQAVNALDESFLKLSGGTMTGTINSRAITPTTAGTITINSTTGAMTDLGNGYDLGTASLPFRAMRTKVIYLGKNENDEDVYVYYDTVNKCVRVQGAGIATDSYISAGGVQST